MPNPLTDDPAPGATASGHAQAVMVLARMEAEVTADPKAFYRDDGPLRVNGFLAALKSLEVRANQLPNAK